MTRLSALRHCLDCPRRALADSPYCDACLRRHLSVAFAEPAWLRRAREGRGLARDLTGAMLR
jgi:hypothetical protein